MAEDSEFLQDLIVIRRHAPADTDGVAHGVWKIAFADFMTAMMCFFLVMWLINAANEDTRQAVASYFNPVRLAEINRKGLADPHLTGVSAPQRGEPSEEAGDGSGTSQEEAATHTREALFRDPYGVLSTIAGVRDTNEPEVADAAAAARPAAQGFRDPFDIRPDGIGTSAATSAASGADLGAGPGEAGALERGDAQRIAELAAGINKPANADEPSEAYGPADAGASGDAAVAESIAAGVSDAIVSEPGAEGAPPVGGVPMSVPPGSAAQPTPTLAELSVPPRATADGALPSIEEAVAAAVKESQATESRNPSVEVERTGEGVLIRLTDDVDFGMFAIGSAEPQPQMVRIMERIAAILRERGGAVTIRGHTDGRPFRNGTYDNWRLSTDRAQMAYYMLVRGGLEEGRVLAIEGYADRKLKVPEDPDASENRRIEILLQEDAG